MTDERDPVRWRDAGSDADPVLQRVLGNAQRGLSSAQADALAQRIEHAVRARVVADAQPRAGLWRKPGMIVAGLASIGLVWFAASRLPSAPAATEPSASVVRTTHVRAPSTTNAPHPAARSENAPRAVAQEHEQAEELAPGTRAPHASSATPTVADGVALAAPTEASPARSAKARARDRRSSKEAPRAGLSSTASSGDGVPDQTSVPPELQLLSEAQRALRSAPALALELAEQHAQAYPAGRFAQEREEIAIEALFALGRDDAGRERARAFLTRYPRSVQAARLSKRLEGVGH